VFNTKKAILGSLGSMLIATTALANPGPEPHYTKNTMKAEPTETSRKVIKVGGYVQFQAGFFEDDFRNVTERDFLQTGEIHVRALHRTENGLEYGAYVQLRAATNATTAADEAKIYVRNKWGEITLGDEDGASDRLAFYAPRTGFGQAVNSFGQAVNADFQSYLDASSRSQIGPKAIDSYDATKITYLSPRIQGFRFGISYAPEMDEGENINRNSQDELGAPAPNVTGNSPANNQQLVDYVQPNINGNRTAAGDNASRGNPRTFFTRSFEDFVEIGANYALPYDDNTVILVSGGYVHAEQKSIRATPAERRHPINAYSIGAQVAHKNFRVGGSWVDNGSSGQLKSVDKQDRNAWNLGVVYDMDRLSFAANYISEDFGGTKTNGSGSYHAFGFGTAYHLLPGMMVGADLVFYKRKYGLDPATPTLYVAPSGLKADKREDSGYVFIVGSQLNF
jgi:outer membrane protein OmpU